MTAEKLTVGGYVRMAVYLLSAVVGVAAVAVNAVGMTELSALLGTIAGAGAAVTGGTAVFNLPKAPDQRTLSGVDAVPAILEIVKAAKTYNRRVASQAQHGQAESDSAVVVAPGVAAVSTDTGYIEAVRNDTHNQ